jgi:DNA repair exonuclease SbcCD nuclease subunit
MDSGDYHCLTIGGKMIKKKSYIGCALRIAVEITVLMLLLTSDASALSNSNGGNWLYFKDVTITNTGSPLNDYQVQVSLAGDNFPLYANESGEDIRFTDASGNELNYWIEKWDNSSKTASIWVKVPSILTGSSTNIKMYYGNPMAISSSNGNATFEFFDDFGDGKYDTNPLWLVEEGTGYWSVKSNELVATISGNNHFDSIYAHKTLYNQSISMRFKSTTGGNRGQNWPAIYPIWNGNISLGTGYYLLFYWSEPWAMEFGKVTSGKGQVITYAAISPDNEYHNFKIDIYEGRFKIYLDDMTTPKIDIVDKQHTISDRFYLRKYGDMGVYYSYFDDIRVRKYASPEPSVSVGGETPNVAENFSFGHLTDVHLGYYPGKKYCVDKLFISAECSPAYMTISTVMFTDTLQSVKKDNLSFILITGDLVQYDNKDFFIAFGNLLKGISIPVNTTPGNHDRRDVIIGDNLSNYNDYIKPISNPSTPDNNYSFDYKGYRFIGLDSGADYSDDLTPEAEGLTNEQIDRLENKFNSSHPKIIFMHHPVMSLVDDLTIKDGALGRNDGAIAINRWNFINYTRDSNVILVLTGHNHNDLIFDISGNLVANSSSNRPLFIQTRSATKDENNGRGYRIVEVKDGEANPYDSESPPRYIRNSGEFNSFKPHDDTEITSRMGLHAYNFSDGHTGMIIGCGDFELGIPESYYTGDYGGSSTPQVIVDYSPIKEYKIYSCQRFVYSNTVKKAQSFASMQDVPSLENIFFNLSIEKQKKTFTTEMGFHYINVTESSIATVNVSDEVKNYKMDLDLDGDGTTDRIIYPDFIDTILAHPQNNIDVIAYNGAGTINLASSSGYFIKAGSLDASLIIGEPSYDFPYGLLAFNISGLGSGQTADVTIILPHNLSSTARYWNYGATSDEQTPHWYQIPIVSNDGDNVITIQLQDGGIGDDDLKANGIITSAGGPGIPLAGKVTGGGWVTGQSAQVSKNTKKATFAFTAQYVDGTPRGSLEYTDHISGMKLKGDVATLKVNKEAATFGGIAQINGTGAFVYTVTVVDKGEPGKDDTFTINIPSVAYTASGALGGGNIQIQDKD